ncbi:TetR family transcriptional regulator [Enterobacteriaceae bacterium 4M9]|nr:TetR family transcriptional regulator [Enterobacteriaceae bacterium 4M9]
MSEIKRHRDPGRRERILHATLDTVADEGIAQATHRSIARRAQVPLGSMTYYFAGIDALLEEAFALFAQQMSQNYQQMLGDAVDRQSACEAIARLICSSQVTQPRNMALMHQFYAFAQRKPALRSVMQSWMAQSQSTLERWFSPAQSRALDAFIEGMTLHYVTDTHPLAQEVILEMVQRLADVQVSGVSNEQR